MSAVSFGDGREPGQGLRWAAVALLVAGAHAGAGWWLVGHSFALPPRPDSIAGVTIDLDPVAAPVAPSEAPQPLATSGPGPVPQIAEAPDAQPDPPPAAEQPPPVEAAAPPPEPAPPETIPAVAPPPTEPPPPLPVPEVVPPPAQVPSEAVLAPPPPLRPTPPKPAAAKPPRLAPPKPDPRRIAQEKARQEARDAAEDARRQRRAARAETRAARAAVARQGGGPAEETTAPAAASSGAAVSTWRGEVMAHLRSYSPASPNGASGEARVAFTVDSGGRVTSASLSGSSGDAELDRAAVAMVRRASPVPAPPPELGGRITLAVPVRFH